MRYAAPFVSENPALTFGLRFLFEFEFSYYTDKFVNIQLSSILTLKFPVKSRVWPGPCQLTSLFYGGNDVRQSDIY